MSQGFSCSMPLLACARLGRLDFTHCHGWVVDLTIVLVGGFLMVYEVDHLSTRSPASCMCSLVCCQSLLPALNSNWLLSSSDFKTFIFWITNFNEPYFVNSPGRGFSSHFLIMSMTEHMFLILIIPVYQLFASQAILLVLCVKSHQQIQGSWLLSRVTSHEFCRSHLGL